MTGTDASYRPPVVAADLVVDQAVSLVGVTEQVGGVLTWVVVPGSDLLLPSAGRYHLWADVHAGMTSQEPPVDEALYARLFDVTAGVEVPATMTVLASMTNFADDPADPDVVGHSVQNTGPINRYYTVTGPTTIRLEAHHDLGHTSGNGGDVNLGADESGVGGDPLRGFTRMGYLKLS